MLISLTLTANTLKKSKFLLINKMRFYAKKGEIAVNKIAINKETTANKIKMTSKLKRGGGICIFMLFAFLQCGFMRGIKPNMQ